MHITELLAVMHGAALTCIWPTSALRFSEATAISVTFMTPAAGPSGKPHARRCASCTANETKHLGHAPFVRSCIVLPLLERAGKPFHAGVSILRSRRKQTHFLVPHDTLLHWLTKASKL